MKTNKLVLISSAIVAVMTSAASASELRGDVDVLLEIGQGCAINGIAAAGVNKFGTVDFGEQSNLALFIDAESTRSGSAGGLELTCNTSLAYAVSLDDGVNALAGQRRVSRGGLDYVQYELYQDAARSVRWGQGPEARALTGTGAAQALTIYGRVLAGQATPAAGNYVDTVRMTIAW
ncbi:spore coat U domain-containing protein [Alishewanella sp. SMS8]|uniref:Csu type fimbrial protein n=1 Tax=Alishewanella sp. SMS8 TaxID=2994676 RepID=UPI002740CD29|nr:spore coat U domain-containing protein [Alishewanella sp. SMS8]MDP5187757.1 spore coat U domain-containing protein [Alishewanella sp.]MDP5458062.1 spore coat U domain-containing protein [Alishewanella sp. SMS8]